MTLVWQYDINSAYPSALRHVPNLQRGEWLPDNEPRRVAMTDFALYRIRSKAYHANLPGPLFCRHHNGTVSYPLEVTGWYWAPELVALREYGRLGLGEHTILEGWRFHPDNTDDKPFAFIEPLYMKRRALKNANDGAHVGIKLGLNSLYGKLAQQVGWRMTDKGARIPPYHQLEYAGFATAHCRATILRAALTDIHAIIAFETDALFSTRPLDLLPLGTQLGEFEATEYESLSYVQSGVYFGTKADGKALVKSRGIDRGYLSTDAIRAAFTASSAEDRYVTTSLTRFVGAGLALAQSWSRWRKWERLEKRLSLEPSGKRIHAACSEDTGEPLRLNVWHSTMCPFVAHLTSAEYPIEWVNPDLDMTELSDLRGMETDYDELTIIE